MPTADGYTPHHALPHFLAERADEPRHQGIGKASDEAVVRSRILKTSMVVITATAIGIAILSVRNPVTHFADLTASLVDMSAPEPRPDPPAPTIQSTVDTQALPPLGGDTPTRNEFAAAVEPVDKSQTEISGSPSEALLKQFEAWAAKENPPAQAGPAQPVQVAPVEVVQNARAAVRPVRKHRKVRPIHNAQTEIRPVQNPRARVVREQNARVQVRPVQDARAQDQSAPNDHAPSRR
jgi:hypothetical protein